MAAPPESRRLQIGFDDNFEVIKATLIYLDEPIDQSDPRQETLEWVILPSGERTRAKTVFRMNTGILLGVISIGLGTVSIVLAIALA